MAIIKYSESGNVVTTLDFDANNFRGVEGSSLMGSILESNAAKEYGKYLVGDYLILLHSSSYTFRAFVSTGDSPSTPVANDAWICVEDGTYTNFGSTAATQGQVIVYNGSTYSASNGDSRLSSLESNKANLASPTFTGTVTIPKTTKIQDTSADHTYDLAVSELTANRIITLPLLTGDDEFVFKDHTQTLTNKTLTAPQISQIELGHASDTTLTRTSAGVVAVEGKEVTTNTDTQTLTNKRLTSPKLNEDVALTATATQLNAVTDNVATNTAGVAANVTDISENTQLIASKDQANLNAHNSITKRLAIAEAETYNGTNLENTEETNEVGIATDGTDISASVVDGSAEVQTEGKGFENLFGDDGNCENLADFESIAGVTASLETTTKVFGTSSLKMVSNANVTTGSRTDGSYSIDATKYYLLTGYAKSNSGINQYLRVVEGGGYTEVLTSSIIASTSWTRGLVKLQPSDLTGITSLDVYLRTTFLTFATDIVYYDGLALYEISAADYALTDAQLLAKFNYVTGLRSSLSHDVESVGVNLFDGVWESGDINTSTGAEIVDSSRIRSKNYLPIQPSTDYVTSPFSGISRIFFYDANFNYISTEGAETWTSPSNARYCRVRVTSTDLSYAFQLEIGSTATTYQPHKSNYAHVPVTLNQVPTAQDTFDIKTGVHGVNTLEYTLTADDITGLATTPVNLDYVEINKPLDSLVYGNTTAIGGSVTQEGASGDTTYADDVSRINYIFQASNLVYGFGVTNGTYADLTAAKTALTGTKIIYELADASKYTVQYPPQNLIAYKDGQMSRIQKLRSNGIAVAGTVTMGTTPISRMGDVYEYIGAESSLVDPDDITLAGDGLSFAVTGGGSDEVYDYVAFIDTSHSTYPTQQVQYTTDNVASKIAKDQKTITVVNVATYDTVNTDNVLLVTYTATGAVTSLTLTSAMALQTGRIITIKDAGGNASVNNITIDTEGAETIDGAGTLVMSTNYQTVKVIADGTNWSRID